MGSILSEARQRRRVCELFRDFYTRQVSLLKAFTTYLRACALCLLKLFIYDTL